MLAKNARSATASLLAAMLLVAAVAPPAVRHVHPVAAGDEIHHRHDTDHGHHGLHCQEFEGSSRHRTGWHASDPGLTSGRWWHLHLQLLGFALTLPEPTSDEDDCEPQGTNAVFVLAASRELLPCQASTLTSHETTNASSTLSAPCETAQVQIAVLSPAPVSSAPLCDSARRERSGVLIA